MSIKLIEVNSLLGHELVDTNHVVSLLKKISADGHWYEPIVIDEESYIVMDGHHRLEVAKKIGLKKIPCALLNYGQPSVSVYKTLSNKKFNILTIKHAAMTGNKLPVKTTRHVLSVKIENVDISLEELR